MLFDLNVMYVRLILDYTGDCAAFTVHSHCCCLSLLDYLIVYMYVFSNQFGESEDEDINTLAAKVLITPRSGVCLPHFPATPTDVAERYFDLKVLV